MNGQKFATATLGCLLMLTAVSPAAHAADPDAAKPAVTRPGSNTWYLRQSQTSGDATTRFRYGHSKETARFMGDWDGDGTATPGILRGGDTWLLRNSNSSGTADITFTFRDPGGQIPVVGDWDGDGVDTPGWVSTVYHCGASDDAQSSCRPADSHWALRNSNTSGDAELEFNFDVVGKPVVGDWDGDGDDGVGAVREGMWWLTFDLDRSVEREFRYGQDGDTPIVGDWDANGIDTPGVVRGNGWFLRNAFAGGSADVRFNYGSVSDTPLVWR